MVWASFSVGEFFRDRRLRTSCHCCTHQLLCNVAFRCFFAYSFSYYLFIIINTNTSARPWVQRWNYPRNHLPRSDCSQRSSGRYIHVLCRTIFFYCSAHRGTADIIYPPFLSFLCWGKGTLNSNCSIHRVNSVVFFLIFILC